MKYRELVAFEPIETVIQLREADSLARARSLVETFVISDRMAEQLTELVFPNLQFERPADNKGVLIVGNYGTGKSHLMSLISAIAEHADLAQAARSPAVVKAAGPVAGKFKVVRTEIGSTTMSLRDIICGGLEDHLRGIGVSFSFPPADKVRNNKDALTEMMAQFGGRFPDHGLLVVVDELLDYLRTRNDQALVLDLNFLREVGEVCKPLRFRFLAGLQESLFDNPRFQFVANSVRRVRDRFEQLRIVRQDVAYVVAERLLKKTPEQQAWIRSHLQKFTPLYARMAEGLEDFVRLFPVHPAYLATFEQIAIAEKREVLKTLSAEMRRRLDQDVPADEPGLISYDSYWAHLRDNASIRSIPEVGEVIDKSRVLEGRIQQAFTKPAYRPLALRICQGLSVHRLTTDDIYARLGPTAAELRDDLCLFLPGLPQRTSDFLLTTVEACLREIIRTMSGQYIAHNEENDQYFLDLKKDVDYDAKIEQRAESLSNSELDRYYFDALMRVMECADQTYVSGYRIWEHEIEWRDHGITRRGYLFFGAPNERSTAQPPRDFYVYFLQPFEPPNFKDERLADEVFFVLGQRDKEFLQALRLYAGAREMAAHASSGTRRVYEDKATGHLTRLTAWLRQHMLDAYLVTHQGVPKKMVEWLKGQRTGGAAVRELVNLVGSTCLAACFAERYPEYPKFSVALTTGNLSSAVEDAIRCLAGGLKTGQATAILDGLELMEGDKIRPHGSRYAKAVLVSLEGKPPNQVATRKELITAENGVELTAAYRLEPELLVVVLLSLTHSGDITISLVGRNNLDAASLTEAPRIPVADLCKFKHIQRPKDIPLASLVALFELVGLPEGLIRNPDTREEAITQLHVKTAELTHRVVMTRNGVQSGIPCWNGELIPSEDRQRYAQRLDGLQGFLERLQAFNTPGKLRNFPFSVEDVKAQVGNLVLVQEMAGLSQLASELAPITSYLTAATALLPPVDPWCSQAEETRSEERTRLLDPSARSAPDFRQRILAALETIRRAYQDRYFDLHQKARLGVTEDEKKRNLMKDPRLERLNRLAGVALLPVASLTDLKGRLAGLKPCFTLVREDVAASPMCPHCNFRPNEETGGPSGSVVLGQIDEQMDGLVENWTRTLLDNLADPTAQQGIELLDPSQKRAVRRFLKDGTLPEKISNDLVQGIQNALSGLVPIPVTAAALLDVLGEGNAPCTVEQFRSRFDEFVQQVTRGQDVAKVRIMIVRDQPPPK